MAAAQGYIGRNPADSSTVIARQSFSPTGIQTDFTFAAGYDVGHVDLYLNGARLVEGQDFTATNGSTVGLTTNAVNGDVLELVAFKAFNATNVTNAGGDFTVGRNLTVSGTAEVTGAITATGGVVGNVTGDATGLSGTPDITVRHLKATGISTVSDTTQSTTTTSGALIVSGGLGVAKNLFVGGSMNVGGTLTYEDVTNSETPGITTTGGLVVTGLGATFGSGVGIADSIYHIDDSNTAIRFPAADTFTVTTAGTEITRVNSTGFGIFTNSPSQALTLRGEQLIETNSTSANSGNGIYWQSTTSGWNTGQAHAAIFGKRVDASNGYLRFDVRESGTTSEKLRIDSSGRLLIGTTSGDYTTEIVNETEANLAIRTYNNGAQNFAGIRLFKARGTEASPTAVSDGDTLHETNIYGHDGSNFIKSARIAAFVDGNPGTNDMPGRLVFATTADGASSTTERLRITSAGRVGINETSPDTLLHIKSADNVLATFESTDADALIEFKDSGTSDSILMGALGGDDLLLRCDAGNIIFKTSNNTEKLRIESGGNVRISDEHLRFDTTGKGIIFGIDGGSNRPSIIGNYTSSSDNNIVFNVTGSERLRIVSGGEVGVNVTPGAGNGILQISGGFRVAGSASASDTTSPYIYRTSGSDHLNIATSGTERLRITSGGQYNFKYVTSQTPRTYANGSHEGLMISVDRDDNSNFLGTVDFAAGRASDASNGGTQLRFWTQPRSSGAAAERLRITSDGNVGINETSPNTQLVVKGASNSTTNSVGNINVISSDSAAINLGGSIGLGGFYNGTSNSIPFANLHGKKENGTNNNALGYFAISTRDGSGTSEKFRIDSSGRVLIGTQTPGATAGEQLTIEDSTNAGITIRTGTSSAGSILFEDDTADRGEIQYSHNGDFLRIKTAGTERFRIDSSGNLTATGNVTAYSDISLKENIETIPNALDKVLNLRGVKFDRIDKEDNSHEIGVIAQEVEQVIPEVVLTNEEGIKSVAYGNLVGLLIESIKELKAEVNDLKAQVEG